MWALIADVYLYPAQGSEPLARGGAWVARATDPIALARNPAGLAGQARGVSAGWDVAVRHSCFARVKAANDPTEDTGTYPRVCDDGAVIPVGYAALVLPLGERLALGIGLVTPTGVPRLAYPSFANGAPAPQRYLLLESSTAMAIPTVGLAYAVTPTLKLGAALGWGIAWVKTSAAAPEVLVGAVRPGDVDVKATVSAVDAFVPRATLGAHWAPSENAELGLSGTWSDSISATADVNTEANAFTARAASGDTSRVYHGRSSDVAHVTIAVPASATIGARVRFPRTSAKTRDPLADENGDVELDATWSNDGSTDAIGVRFTPGTHVVGTGGELAPNADSERRYRSTVGFHAGGDYVVVPNRLAVRAGAFFLPRAAEPGFSGLEAMAGQRIGFAFGGTVRVRTFNLSLAYMHMFVADLTSTHDGIHAAAGQSPFRTPWPVALGTQTDGLDVFHLGFAYRFGE